ncbi:hypothetical protein ASPZODRAFT_820254 [Penicilliopsis zonata CBS 506.65]|uniref:Amine oxidase domain-containing protein n=1 Tax=Penicilliopsis zonata CBS 506.65 TaxID=1073090 RepID=A0A1L9SA60_9EURO|nr:hypothetical protein ASPZODRAFT_820254 [Penicilliopsis zonata CBS 506.65]OJJ44038.1 hypothetical protein ASPZODRAFT_820254 [Penicilliopsis zonata CBS 506.65]
MCRARPKRVAVIGGGCVGITAFWALQRSVHDVHLYEASSQLGGRIKSLSFEFGGQTALVDTEPSSFDVHASPNLVSLLTALGVHISHTPVSFAVSTSRQTIQWALGDLNHIFTRGISTFRPNNLRLLFDMVRFRYFVADFLANDQLREYIDESTICTQEYLSNEGFSDAFREEFLIPLVSILCRVNLTHELLRLSLGTLFRLFFHQQFLYPSSSEDMWYHIDGGSSGFLRVLAQNFASADLRLNTRVTEVNASEKGGYVLVTSTGQKERYDHIVIAVDSQQGLQILDPVLSHGERGIMRNLRTTKTIAVLHSDHALMTESHQDRSSYHYVVAQSDSSQSSRKSCLSYNINALQNLPHSLHGNITISLNALTPPHPRLVQNVWEYTDLEICPSTIKALALLPSIQNKRGLSFCHEWTGRGFLEDAVTAGLRVAIEHLGAEVPFQVVRHGDSKSSRPLHYEPGLGDHVIRTLLRLLQVYILIFEISVALLRRFRVHKTGKVC